MDVWRKTVEKEEEEQEEEEECESIPQSRIAPPMLFMRLVVPALFPTTMQCGCPKKKRESNHEL